MESELDYTREDKEAKQSRTVTLFNLLRQS